MKQILILGLFLLLVLAMFFLWPKKSSLSRLAVGNAVLKIEIANTLEKQLQGLSGRKSLPASVGMLFVFEKPKIQNFWMKDMNFSLDMIFIKDHRVVEIFENVPIPVPGQETPRVQSQEEADMVLEVNAGSVEKYNIRIGDEITLLAH